MPRPLAVALLILVAVLLLAAIGTAWRRRVHRSEATMPPPPTVPAERGALLVDPVDAVYVSTTLGGSRYERVAGYTLGARSTATVEVTAEGVLLVRPATKDVFIPADALREVGTSGGMVGKYVGGDGLVVLRWQLGDRLLDTGLRLGNRAAGPALLTALTELIGAQHSETTHRAPAPGTDDEGRP